LKNSSSILYFCLVWQRKIYIFCHLFLSLSLFSLHFSLQLFAQEKDPPSQENSNYTELTVYGANQIAPLKDVPSSVIVIDTKSAAESGHYHLDSYLESTPNVTASGGSNRSRFFQIRGIGEVEQYEGAPNPSVGVFIDDFDLSSLGGVGALFDIESVEILRGPQVTRYGSNALAGAMQLRSREATKDYTALIQSSLGNDDMYETGFAVGGPINQELLFRVSAHNRKQDGFRENKFLNRDDTNGRDETTSRLKLAWIPSSDLRIDLGALFSDFDNGYDAFAIDNGYKTQSDKPGDDVQRTAGLTFKVTSELDQVELVSISSYLDLSQNYSFDGDWGNNQFWSPYDPYDYFSSSNRKREVWSQELRATSNNLNYKHGRDKQWMGGVFASILDEDTVTQEEADTLVYDSLSSDYHAKTAAMFGSYEAPLGYDSALTLSFRAERRLMRYLDDRPTNFNPGDTMLGGGAVLSHDLNQNLRSYLGLTRGFKGGGVNPGLSIPEGEKTYDPEYLWNLEGGLKGASDDGSLSATLALFYMKRKDAQAQISYQDDPSDPLAFTYLTDNATSGEAIGGEFDTVITPFEKLSFTTHAGLLLTEYTSLDDSQTLLEDRDFSNAPRWQYDLGVKYSYSNRSTFIISTSGSDKFYFSDGDSQQSSRAFLLNASNHINLGKKWRLSLWGRNILDERYETRGFYFGNEPPDFIPKRYVQLGDRRTFGITLNKSF
jgi:outer membrane receptor protein involved in Fe transport